MAITARNQPVRRPGPEDAAAILQRLQCMADVVLSATRDKQAPFKASLADTRLFDEYGEAKIPEGTGASAEDAVLALWKAIYSPRFQLFVNWCSHIPKTYQLDPKLGEFSRVRGGKIR